MTIPGQAVSPAGVQWIFKVAVHLTPIEYITINEYFIVSSIIVFKLFSTSLNFIVKFLFIVKYSYNMTRIIV